MFERFNTWWQRRSTDIAATFVIVVMGLGNHWTAAAIILMARVVEVTILRAVDRLLRDGGEVIVVKPETSELVEQVIQALVDEKQRRRAK